MKKCTMCKQTDETVEFTEKGFRYCKSCVKINNRKHAAKNGVIEKYIPIVTDTEKECCSCKKMKLFSEYTPTPRGRKGLAAYCKPCMSQYQIEHTPVEVRRLKTQKYRDENKEWWRSLHRINQFNRRMKLAAVTDGTVTKEFVIGIYALNECYYCQEETPLKFRTMEHILPLNKGGSHTAINVTMACLACNSSKADKTEEEFKEYRKWKKKQKIK